MSRLKVKILVKSVRKEMYWNVSDLIIDARGFIMSLNKGTLHVLGR